MKTTQEHLLGFIFELAAKTDPKRIGRQLSEVEGYTTMNELVNKYAKLIDEDKEIILKINGDD